LRNRNKKQDGGVKKKLHTRGIDQYKGLKVQMEEIADVSVCVWEDSGTLFHRNPQSKNGAKFETETLMIDNEMTRSLLSPEDGNNFN
jgi:hypothetical protein